MTNKDDNASKLPTTLTSRPTTEQQEEARRWEKVQRVTNNNHDNEVTPPMTTTTMMTTMTTSCQSLPIFIGFFIPCRGGGCSDDGGSGASNFGASCGG
jgi:hypothetical protein